MKKHWILWVIGGLVLSVGAVTAEEKRAGTEQSVVVPLDNRLFKVSQLDIVRLVGKGIAGSKIEAEVEGPAKVKATNHIAERKDGHPLIGNSIKEFNLKPSGKGQVKVKIYVTSPIPGAKPKVTEYDFEVE